MEMVTVKSETPKSAAAAETLAARYAAAGLPCEIEAGTGGLVIYADSPKNVLRIAGDIANAVRSRDPKVHVEVPPSFDEDEPPATAWWVCVTVDWKKF